VYTVSAPTAFDGNVVVGPGKVLTTGGIEIGRAHV
jgi:hypothetical protein